MVTPDPSGLPAHYLQFLGIFAFPVAAGLLSGVTHCAAMCGPIHLFLARHEGRGGIWFYHLGRIITYAFLGGLVGMLGWTFRSQTTGWIWAGAYVLMGLKLLGLPLWPSSWEGRYGNWILQRLRPVMRQKDPSRRTLLFLPMGLAAGFLPCATTQAGLVWSAGTSSAWIGGGGMLLLGVATLPLFLAWPRKLIPVNRTFYHIALGTGLLVLAAWRIRGLLFAIHPFSPEFCQ